MKTALLVAASPDASPELVRSLADAADLVIAVDGGGALAMQAGVTPDIVVGDLDSLSRAVADELTLSGTRFQTHPADKDVSDFRLALDAARARGVRRIVATAVLGGRLDHALGNLGELARSADLEPIIVEADTTVVFATATCGQTVHVRGECATFSAIAVLGPAEVSITGARWPLVRHTLEPLETLGISNRVVNGPAAITVHVGTLAIVAPTVDGTRAVLEDEDGEG